MNLFNLKKTLSYSAYNSQNSVKTHFFKSIINHSGYLISRFVSKFNSLTLHQSNSKVEIQLQEAKIQMFDVMRQLAIVQDLQYNVEHQLSENHQHINLARNHLVVAQFYLAEFQKNHIVAQDYFAEFQYHLVEARHHLVEIEKNCEV